MAKPTDQSLPRLLGMMALVIGSLAAWFYFRGGLTLSHYDAKAHLVVARRIFDNRTPGLLQVGAVWLPLPHLLNALPVQIDAFYRTGFSAVAMSVASFALTVYACARLILGVTGSKAGATLAAVALAANPAVLYLQATPMTEPLLLGLSVLGVLLTFEWVRAGGTGRGRAAGWTLAALCLTRYEGWLVTAAAIAGAVFALWRQKRPLRIAARSAARLAVYPAVAILVFAANSRYTLGEWVVTGGFFVVDNPAFDNLPRAVGETLWGTRVLTGFTLTVAGLVSAVVLAIRACRSRGASERLVALALGASALLPCYAFFQGHPFRIRYMVPMVVAMAVWSGLGVGLLRRGQTAAAALLIGFASFEMRPFDSRSPMVLEAQWDQLNSVGRRMVTACLTAGYRGEPILASMGSLAHYIQELSHEGFAVHDFVHEGNHPEWDEAIATPHGRVGWILIEEQSEGGDVLAMRARQHPTFLDGFRRICSGGGVAVYQAVAAQPRLARRNEE